MKKKYYSSLILCITLLILQTLHAQTNNASPYGKPTNLKNNNFYITNVTIDNINNESTQSSNGDKYTYFNNQTTSINKGGTYNLNLAFVVPRHNNYKLKAWIDYNNNNVFEASEEIDSFDESQPDPTVTKTITFTVPNDASATPSDSRMRIFLARSNVDPLSSSNQSGEAEDYNITIKPFPVAPTANCIGNLNIDLDIRGNASITPNDIDNNSVDDYDLPADLILSLDKTNFDCNDIGANTVTLTVTDTDGLSSTCNTTVNISGYSGSFTAPPLDTIEAYCSYNATAPIMHYQCNQVILPTTTDPLFYNTVGSHIITWTYDNGSNTVNADQTIIINAPPTLTTPTATNFTQTSTTLNWTGGSTGDPFIVRYKPLTDSNWLEATSTNNSIQLTDLNIGIEYEAQVKIEGDCTTFTSSVTFETLDIEYCENTPISINDNAKFYISQTNIDDISNTTVTTDGPYDYYENLSASLTAGGVISGSITYHRQANNTVGLIVWIDYNKDGDFKDDDEIIYSVLNNGSTQTSFTINFSNIVPIDAVIGKTRMRIALQHNGIPTDECTYHQKGEIEDYNVFIRPIPSPPTAKAKNIQVNLDASGTAIITPEQINDASFDDFDNVADLLLSLDTTTFTCNDINQTKTVTLTVQDTDGLTDTTTAEVSVYGYPGIFVAPILPDVETYCDYTITAPIMNFQCDTEIIGVSTSHTIGNTISSNAVITWEFTNGGDTVSSTQNINFVTPTIPTNILFPDITRRTANVIWQDSSTGPYKVRYRENGTTNSWIEKTTASKNILLTNLDSQTTYELQVSIDASCATYSTSKTFTTGAASPLEKVMITQIYHDGSNERWIEITNNNTHSIASNTMNIVLFKDTSGDQTGVTPTASYELTTSLTAGQTILIKKSSASIIAYTGTAIDNDNVTDFDGANDIIILSSTTDDTAWTNRVDVIQNITDNTSYVRNDDVLLDNITYSNNEWTPFVDNALEATRPLADGGVQRHPENPTILEIDDSPNSSAYLGVHHFGSTQTVGTENWDNGEPDKSRTLVINTGYTKTTAIVGKNLEIKGGARLAIDGSSITITDNITINDTGEIRLRNGAQLVQTHSDNSKILGTGKLYTEYESNIANLYRYNYLSSPVNSVGSNTFTLGDVMRDGSGNGLGTSSTPREINFINTSDGSVTYASNGTTVNQISIPNQWIYTFTSAVGNTANFSLKESTGSIGSIDGFTLKGPGIAQNYIFQGTPKDGTLTSIIGSEQFYLVGNPYPSAIRASKFIEDNMSSLDGTIYFWDHVGEEDTLNGHFFDGYIGGYATQNLTMALSADQFADNSTENGGTPDLGAGAYKTPSKYIPVGQGFFVNSNTIGGAIEFNNSQREIRKISSLSVFFKTKKLKTLNSNIQNTIEEVKEEKDLTPIIKIGINYTNNEHLELHHQIGISFHKNNSFNYEPGYDSFSSSDSETDMYWKFNNDDNQYVITGVQEISDNLEIPLEIKVGANNQPLTIDIDEWQNIDREVYLLDKQTNETQALDNGKAVLNLSTGIYTDRFAITFKEAKTLDLKTIEENTIVISNSNKEITVQNFGSLLVKHIELYNITGQKIKEWSVSNSEKEYNLDVANLASHIYILKIKTNKGTINRKILIE